MQTGLTGRNKNLKIPKVVPGAAGKINTVEDLFAAREAYVTAHNQKLNSGQELEKALELDAELEMVSKIPESSSDLIVITKIKKLGAYIIAVTEKSPAKFRGVFVNRLQNFCLDALQDIFKANFIHMDTLENKQRRESFQTEAIIKLKMLAYIAMVAENAGCILTRQYKQISLQAADVINLTSAWKKSDDEKWRKKI